MALKAVDPPSAPDPGEALISIRGLCKRFNGVAAVEDLDIDIRRGEFFTMLGPSGSGKTTTLRLIAGFERPDAGTITLDGRDMAQRAPFERDVNTVFQDYALFPHMTVAQNIAYGLEARKLPRDEIAARVAEALRMVQLVAFGERKPDQLSGGQRQRVGLARAIVNRPRLLLLDEPLGALDLKLRQEMQMELKQIQQSLGITFLYVTHDQEEALSMSDRVAVFNAGRIEQIAAPHDLYECPATEFVAGFVGTSSILERGGERLALRPEKLHVSERAEDFAGETWQTEKGVLTDSVYAGIFTRHIIRLDAGETVVAVEQNRTRYVAKTRRGAEVWVGWRRDEVFSLKPKG